MRPCPHARLRVLLATATLCLLVLIPAGTVAQQPVHRVEDISNVYFGEAVSTAGDGALIGSSYGADGKSPGLAYVFEHTADGWQQTAALAARDEPRLNMFGSAVAYAETTALVGARGTGTAYIFERGAGGWDQAAMLSHPGAELFGYSVALHGDTAVVGAPGVRDTSRAVPAWSGAVFIWAKDATGWRYRGEIAPDAAASSVGLPAPPGPYRLFENFGQAVALHDDVLVVSAHNGTIATGKVYVFRRRDEVWRQEAELNQQRESFGVAIAVAARTIAVASSGLVYMYAYADGGWSLQTTVEPRVARWDSGFQYGGSVSIDGSRMVAGAIRYGKRRGAAHIFERSGSGWKQVATITGDDTKADSRLGTRVGDLFGGSVAIHGERVLVGASMHDSGGPNFGAAYVFSRDGSRWLQSLKLVPRSESP